MMLKEFFDRENILFYGELPADSLLIWNREKWNRMEEKMGKVESAALFLIPYFAGQKTTNLSVYAQVRDYHLYVRNLSERFQKFLEEKGDGRSFAILADSSPIDERDAALKASLGVMGKNGLVLNETYGSFFFIGEIFLSRAFSPQEPKEKKECIGCGKCIKSCPTGAILDPKREKCLSLISQKKNRTPEEEALLLQATCKWGCDLCQNHCPMNQNAEETPIAFFREGHISHLTSDVIESPKEEFQTRAFSWRGRKILRDNLNLEGNDDEK